MARTKLAGERRVPARCRVTKRSLACALVLALALLGAGTASAATMTFEPGFGYGSLGEASTASTHFKFSGTEYGGHPSPVTEVILHLPEGVGGSAAGFATCPSSDLENHEPEHCPSGSIAGPPGWFAATVAFGGTLVQEEGRRVQGYFVPGGIDFYLEGITPVSLEATLNGTYTSDSSPYGKVLKVTIPLMETVPGAPYVSLSELNLQLGTTREEGGTEYSSLTIPAACPTSPATFKWKAEATFYKEAATKSASEETVCPSSTPRIATTTSVTAPKEVVVNEPVTYTVTVTPASSTQYGAPFGWVAFTEGEGVIPGCAEQPLTQGISTSSVTCQMTYVSEEEGTYSIAAHYSGEYVYRGSKAPPQTVTVVEHLASKGGGTKETSTTTTSTTATTTTTMSASPGAPTNPPSKDTVHSSKTPTVAQKLAKALKMCKKMKSRRKRNKCEARARKRYHTHARTRRRGRRRRH